MWQGLGLRRDPFAAAADGGLFWETPEREAARSRAAEALECGRGVVLVGPEGSGRDTLLARIADEALGRGIPVLWVAPSPDFLASAVEAMGAEPPATADEAARVVYEAVLERFVERGAVLVAVEGRPDAGALAELEALAALRVAGQPLALPLWVGDGSAGPPAEIVPVPRPSREDLRAFLFHRLAAVGGPDLVPLPWIDRIAAHAGGFGDALRLGRQALRALAFGGEVQEANPPAEPVVLDPGSVDEVEELLSALQPEESGP